MLMIWLRYQCDSQTDEWTCRQLFSFMYIQGKIQTSKDTCPIMQVHACLLPTQTAVSPQSTYFAVPAWLVFCTQLYLLMAIVSYLVFYACLLFKPSLPSYLVYLLVLVTIMATWLMTMAQSMFTYTIQHVHLVCSICTSIL